MSTGTEKTELLKPDMGKLVHAEKLRLLYQQSFVAVLGNMISAALLVVILWPVQQKIVLISWYTVILIFAVFRIALFIRYRKKLPQGIDILVWERPYVATLYLVSLVWGIGALYIMPADSEFHQAVIYFFLMGMSGGAVAVYSAQRQITLITIACMLLPATIWYFLQGSLVSVSMALGACLFLIAVFRSGKVLSDTMHNSFLLSYELIEAKEIAERLAETDELTGLSNRRIFYKQGRIFVDHSKRNDVSLALILMDMDHFKDINDTYGHAAGDATLTHIGMILRQAMRRSDICARIGGEEFGMLLPGATLEGAEKFAEKLRLRIVETPVVISNERISVSASFGISVGNASIDELFKHADAMLYKAKAAGRNCVVLDSDAAGELA